MKKKNRRHRFHKPFCIAACLFLISFIFNGCGGGPLKVESLDTGSDIDILHGTIDNSSLSYSFPEPKKNRCSGDIFNHLYFEGDTLCFSYTLSRRLWKKQVSVKFINPANGMSFPAERIEVYRYRVFGFSLVGSLMEQFYKSELKKPAPADDYCCRDIPFIIEATFRDRGESVTHSHKGTFRIKYLQSKKP